MRLALGSFLLGATSSVLHALEFADGIKVGEVTDTSAVIWVRLTQRDEADNRVAEWRAEKPWQWAAPGAAGSATTNGSFRPAPAADSVTPEWQKFFRIKGGTLSGRVEGRKASVRHHDVEGMLGTRS